MCGITAIDTGTALVSPAQHCGIGGVCGMPYRDRIRQVGLETGHSLIVLEMRCRPLYLPLDPNSDTPCRIIGGIIDDTVRSSVPTQSGACFFASSFSGVESLGMRGVILGYLAVILGSSCLARRCRDYGDTPQAKQGKQP
jgi:hypothetical protein